MPRSDVTIREVAVYEAALKMGIYEERERVEKLLKRARWHAKWGRRKAAIRLIDKALAKEADDARE